MREEYERADADGNGDDDEGKIERKWPYIPPEITIITITAVSSSSSSTLPVLSHDPVS